jgi:hypothetical protein
MLGRAVCHTENAMAFNFSHSSVDFVNCLKSTLQPKHGVVSKHRSQFVTPIMGVFAPSKFALAARAVLGTMLVRDAAQ